MKHDAKEANKTASATAFISLLLIAGIIPTKALAYVAGWVCEEAAGSVAQDNLSAACGIDNRAYASGTTVFGQFNSSEAPESVVFGYKNEPIPEEAATTVVVGSKNTTYANSVVIGRTNTNYGDNGALIGNFNYTGDPGARANGAIAIGQLNRIRTAPGPYATSNSIAIGDRNFVGADESIAMGASNNIGTQEAPSAFSQSLSLGNRNNVHGSRSLAIGSSINIGASNGPAVNDGIALGSNTVVQGNASMAIGAGAQALGENSAAIGAGAVASRSNQIAIGTASSTYTAAGVTSAASRAAQAGPTSFVTTDVNGNLANSAYGPQDIASLNTSVYGLNNAVGVLGMNVSAVSNRVDGNQREARQGIAMAMAMPSTHFPSARGKTTVSGSLGNYKGYGAVGAAFMHRLDTEVPLAVGVSTSIGMRNSVGVKGEFVAEF